jgi:inactivated superfamily I helicase
LRGDVTATQSLSIASDARAAERRLVDWVASRAPSGAIGPGVLVVVPSQSLRRHLQARLLRERPSWLGVEVATLYHVAHAIVAAAGQPPPRGGLLFETLLARAARRDPGLSAAFGAFADGWRALAAPARDLVDAGFVPELAEALLERIDAERGALSARVLARARALVVATADALRALDRLGLAPNAALLACATEQLSAGGPALLGGRAIAIHGFADATGAATELLVALARHAGASALLVEARLEGEERFGARLRERLEGVAGAATKIEESSAPARLRRLAAPTPDLEARAVAATVARALEDGVAPERIGVVLRDPAARRSPLARALDRHGVPYSASAAHGPPASVANRASGVLRLVERGGGASADAALELAREAPDLPAAALADARLVLRATGVVRLDDAGRLSRGAIEDHRRDGFPLPVRAGVEPGDDGVERAPHRRLPVESLLAASARLHRARAVVEAWPESAPWTEHRAALVALAAAVDDAASRDWPSLLGSARALDAELPASLPLSRSEALDLLARAWEPLAREPWGGAGAGVQLLSVTEARGATFDRLVVAGLERSAFPRSIAEEPLLVDSLRARLRELLPDLPVKTEGHDEERYLFATLLGAADEVVLLRASRDEDGRELPPSPFLDALARGRGVEETVLEDGTGDLRPVAALDRATSAALSAGTRALSSHLAPALEEGRRRFAPPENRGSAAPPGSAAVARARLATLIELDTDPSTPEGALRIAELGPYFGFVGRGSQPDFAAATTLERHAACGWQSFLERTLRLEPLPDPLAALPALGARVVGTATHAALAELFEAEGDGAALAARLAAPAPPLRWPEPARVEAAIVRAVERTARAEGVVEPGLLRLLEVEVRARLEVARAIDAQLPAANLLGSELSGELARDSRERVAFRADRVHREGELLVFVDWKGGGVPHKLDFATADTRRKKLLAAVASGVRLQAAVYAAAVPGTEAEARYVHLGEEPSYERTLALLGDDATSRALDGALDTLFEARRLGLHPPRLLDPKLEKAYSGCERCAVADACVQGDSGFRLRLTRWHEGLEQRVERGELAAAPARDLALWRLWRLPAVEAGNER